MTKTRSTKRALLLSALAIIVSVTMLVGSTFAWFTDSVTSSGNKIVAGTLDVQLHMFDGTDYVDISNNTNSIFDIAANANNSTATLWEPGKTQVVYLAIKNAGSLALKYTVGLNVKNVAKDLYEVLKYSITPDGHAVNNQVIAWDAAAGLPVVVGNQSVSGDVDLAPEAIHYFALSIHMDEEAGNDYQGGEVDFDLTVLATQTTAEADSFGTDYDVLAAYPYNAVGKLEDGQTAVELAIKDNDSIKVGTAVVLEDSIADPTKQVESVIVPSSYAPNITVATGMEQATFDITFENIKEGNTTPIKVQLFIGEGLDPATVAVYHYSDEIAATYDPYTGYVTFESATFSPFTLVYDAESVYVPPVVDPDGFPTATVVRSSEYEKVDLPWGSYGAWSPTEGLDCQLEGAYTFSCNETLEQAEANPYANWHCDFYVKLDKDLGENQIFLGGNYGSFGWVGFHNGDVTLAANEEIPLLGSVTSNPWTYASVVQNVGTFICGVGDVNNALSGATFTVMLRLTNPDDESDYKNVATINYTFQ